MTSIIDPIGNEINITYSQEEVVLTQGNQQVVYKKVNQDGKELLSQVIDQEGRVTTYDYSIKTAKFNLLSSLTTSTKAKTNPYALIVGVTLPTGAKTVYEYEDIPINRYLGSKSVNQVYRILNREEHNVFEDGSYEVKNIRNMSYQRDMSGYPDYTYTSDMTYTTSLSDSRKNTTYEFKRDYIDSNTPPVYYNTKETKEAGTEQIITTYTYDEARRLPAPNNTLIQYTDSVKSSDPITISRQYDDYGNVLSDTNSLGITTTYQYDTNTHLLTKITKPISDTQTQITEYTRYPEGKIHIQTIKNQNSEVKSYIEYQYDTYGNPILTNVTDDGQVITYETNYSNEYQYAYPTTIIKNVTDVDGVPSIITNQYRYNPSTGSLIESIDGRGNKTAYQYDNLGRVEIITYPDLSSIQVSYDDLKNEIEVTDEMGIKSIQKWNSLGWLEQEGIIDNTVYKAKQKYGYDDYGRQIWNEDAIGNRTDFNYDLWDRQKEIIYPDGSIVSYQYDDINFTKTTIDPEGIQIKETYDKLNRLVKTEEIKQTESTILTNTVYDYADNILYQADAKGNITSYQYDVLGQLKKVTDSNSQDTDYLYNQRGNLTRVIYSDGKTIEKQYDEIGRLIKQIDSKGEEEKFYYDGNSNLIKHIDRKDQTLNYQYDLRNRLINKSAVNENISYEYSLNGKRTKMIDLTGTTRYSYNSIGLLDNVQYPDGREIIYDFNELGNRTTLIDPYGQKTNYQYNNNNQLVGLSLGNDIVNEVDYLYDNNGRIKAIKQRNGITTDFTYDGIYLANLTHKDSDSTILNSYQYGHDNNGNITNITENDIDKTFTYDDLNRIETSSEFNEHYTYDSRGNRQTLLTNQQPELTNTEYEYNPWNQLLKVTKEDGTIVNYKYNGDGLLYERTENGETTRYYYDKDQVITEGIVSGSTANHKTSYIRGIGLVARIDANGEKAYYLSNGHNDIVELRNSSGNLLNSYTYDIWGNPLTVNETIDNPFMYSGELWDEEAELQYLRARWYDPSIGRFISEDTYEGDITNPLSLNYYTYVYNNPLIYVDSSGNIVETVVDVASIGWSAYELWNDPSWINAGFLLWDLGAA